MYAALRLTLWLCAPVLLMACAAGPFSQGRTADVPPQTDPATVAEVPALRPLPPPAGAKTAAALDTTSVAQKTAALAAPSQPAAERTLGKTAVALGNVTEPGFWLRSALVSSAGKGRAVTAQGKSIQVDLIPGSGAAQLSLAAFRALDLPLTGLPEVTIFAQ